jgi:hypothetical protein
MVYIPVEDLMKIREYIVKDNEVCGYFFYNESNLQEIKIIKVSDGPNILKTGRGSCDYGIWGNKRCIWHTHPMISKVYPSDEDIVKVLLNSNINISIIFSLWGIWEITTDLDYKYPSFFNKEEQLKYKKKCIDLLAPFSKKLYYDLDQSKKSGQKYRSLCGNLDNYLISIDEYIKSITKLFNIKITFTRWNKRIYNIKFDKICDTKRK